MPRSSNKCLFQFWHFIKISMNAVRNKLLLGTGAVGKVRVAAFLRRAQQQTSHRCCAYGALHESHNTDSLGCDDGESAWLHIKICGICEQSHSNLSDECCYNNTVRSLFILIADFLCLQSPENIFNIYCYCVLAEEMLF